MLRRAVARAIIGLAVFAVALLPVTPAGAVPGTFRSSISIQNNNAVTANVTVRFFDTAGNAAVAQPLTYTIAPGQSQLVYVPNVPGLPPGRFTVTVDSDVPVVATTNAAANGSTTSSVSYQAIAQGTAGSTLFVPGVYRNYHGYVSALTVANLGSATQTITVTYKGGDSTTVGTDQRTLDPGASGVLDLSLATGVPDGFAGSAVVTGTDSVGVTYTSYNANTQSLDGAVGFLSGASTVYAPSVMKNYYGWSTAVMVQNLDTTAANVTLSFTGGGQTYTTTVLVQPGASQLLWQGSTPSALPDGFLGSVSAASDGGQQIALVVNESNAAGAFASYNGVATAQSTTMLSLPTVMNGYYGWVTSFLIQNVDTVPATVTLAYYSNGQVVQTLTETVPPGASVLHYQPNDGLSAGFFGSVVATSDGARIAGVVNQNNPTQTGDALMTYGAFPTTP